MFGLRIGGSGKLYLQAYLRAYQGVRWQVWKAVTLAEYHLEGRYAEGRVLLNDPTLPHPGSGRLHDPTRYNDGLAEWRELQELRASTRDLLLASEAELNQRRQQYRRRQLEQA